MQPLIPESKGPISAWVIAKPSPLWVPKLANHVPGFRAGCQSIQLPVNLAVFIRQ